MSADKDDELKPCPCCGGKASIGNSEPDGSGGYFVECDDCGVTTPLIYNMMGTVRRELLDKWNRRVVRPESGPNSAAGQAQQEAPLGVVESGTSGRPKDRYESGSDSPAPAAPATPRTDELERFIGLTAEMEGRVVDMEYAAEQFLLLARQLERELAEKDRLLDDALHTGALLATKLETARLTASLSASGSSDHDAATEYVNAQGHTIGETGNAISNASREHRAFLAGAEWSRSTNGEPSEPQHVCGLQGYDPMIDAPCPGCEARSASGTPSK